MDRPIIIRSSTSLYVKTKSRTQLTYVNDDDGGNSHVYRHYNRGNPPQPVDGAITAVRIQFPGFDQTIAIPNQHGKKVTIEISIEDPKFLTIDEVKDAEGRLIDLEEAAAS
jgi:hypothetical protein